MRNGIPVLWCCGPRGVSHVNRTKLTRLFRGVVIEEKYRSTNQTMVRSHVVLTVPEDRCAYTLFSYQVGVGGSTHNTGITQAQQQQQQQQLQPFPPPPTPPAHPLTTARIIRRRAGVLRPLPCAPRPPRCSYT
jgi:hypothetical protein